MSPEVMVNAIEVQKVLLVDRAGEEHEIGQTLPEAKHIRSLKSTAALTREFKAMVDAYAAANSPRVVPFGDGNAAPQWMPAISQAAEYAKSLGFKTFGYEGSGVMARSMSGPTVKAIEFQNVYVETSRGRKVPLGQVLPEASHLREIKSTQTLVAEFKQLIDGAARDAASATTRRTLGGERNTGDAMPEVGRPSRRRTQGE
jgi:hypothetical protein